MPMEFVNLKDTSDTASFEQAVRRGLGREQGLYFPDRIPVLPDVPGLLDLPFVDRSAQILASLTGLEEQLLQDIRDPGV